MAILFNAMPKPLLLCFADLLRPTLHLQPNTLLAAHACTTACTMIEIAAWHTHPHEPVLGLKLLGHLDIVVDEAKAGALAAAKLGPHAKHKDAVQVLDVVHLGQLLPQLSLQG